MLGLALLGFTQAAFSRAGFAQPVNVCLAPLPTTFGTPAKPLTGYSDRSLEPFDRVMTRLLERYQIPGASLAVSKDGRLLLARGYGWADVEAKEPVHPDSLFRIGSLTKPITAVTVLHLGEQLVRQGRFPNLETFLQARVYELLALEPKGGQLGDPRIADITVRDLLQHSAGWNRNVAGDPMFRPTLTYVARSLGMGEAMPVQPLIEYMFSRKLSFTPGTFSAYSNLGYAVLGQLIERLSAQSYAAYLQKMLGQMGIHHITVGHTRLQDRLPGEVRYYDFPNAPLVPSVLDGSMVPRPYGEFYLEAQAANGGLVASAPELVKFVAVLEGHRPEASPISPEARKIMLERPPLPQYKGSKVYYALGWSVRPEKNGLMWSHDGALAGTRTLLLRLPDDTVIAAFFNSRPWNDWSFIADLKNSLLNAAQQVTRWPGYDCF
ncbi:MULTISPECIES: serine hydrolase [unclassified Meiothermus]|uniref:serine hydrolase domain-containing protein n=1 Tax=unclassified Meiothermus TaxID=370471 RepID=UPI00131444B9|nr:MULTISPECIES: serine hydrolase domain-containing protein [unclassified Meiothermus]